MKRLLPLLSLLFFANTALAHETCDEEKIPEINEKPTYIYGDLVINETVSNPQAGENEWVELVNRTNTVIDMEGWYIQEGSGAKTTFGGSIGPGEFSIITNLKGNLNNGGDTIQLFDSHNTLISMLEYGEEIPAAQKGFSLARVNEDFFLTTTITPGDENSITKEENNQDENKQQEEALTNNEENNEDVLNDEPENSINTKITDDGEADVVQEQLMSIEISEFVPNPLESENNEWIELYNPNNQELDLTNWSIDDQQEGSKPFLVGEITIPANGYTVLDKETTKIALNNDTDAIRLINPKGEVVSEVLYSTTYEGLSYAKAGDAFYWTEAPTPGAPNIIFRINEDEKNDPINISLDEFHEYADGDTVELTGTVLVEPGKLGSQILYIGNPGVQIYFYKKEWPELARGDHIQVHGVVRVHNELSKLHINEGANISVLETGREIPSIGVVEKLEDEMIHSLMTIEGTALDRSTGTITMANSEQDFLVVLKSGTNITSKEFIEGKNYKITGILTKNDDLYEVMPRDMQDIEITSADESGVEEEKEHETVLTTDQTSGINRKLLISFFIFGISAGIIILVVKKTSIMTHLKRL